MTTVTIRKGFAAYGLASLCFLFGGYTAWALLQGFLDRGLESPTESSFAELVLEILILAGLIAFSAFCLWAGFMLLRQRYVVSLAGIEATGLWRKRFISWKEVKMLAVMPTFIEANNIKLFLHNGGNISLFTALLAHHEKSAKAILEASHKANSNIEFKFLLSNEYGRPPYGIFKGGSE